MNKKNSKYLLLISLFLSKNLCKVLLVFVNNICLELFPLIS